MLWVPLHTPNQEPLIFCFALLQRISQRVRVVEHLTADNFHAPYAVINEICDPFRGLVQSIRCPLMHLLEPLHHLLIFSFSTHSCICSTNLAI